MLMVSFLWAGVKIMTKQTGLKVKSALCILAKNSCHRTSRELTVVKSRAGNFREHSE